MNSIKAFLVASLLLSATVSDGAEESNAEIRFCGWGAVEAGQIIKGTYANETVDHLWQQRLFGQLSVDAIVKERLHIALSTECRLSFSYPEEKLFFATQQSKFSFYPHRIDASYSLGNLESSFLQIGAGYFPVKYNPEARNLGEYLFRTGVYPNYIISDFDFPMARLLGFRLDSDLFGWLHQDLLFHSEVAIYPTQDFSLSYMIHPRIKEFLTLGAGISFHRLIPTDKDRATPRESQNIIAIDTLAVHQDALGYDSIVADTSFYAFGGIKLMGRFTFDPKAFLKTEIFGKEDLKLYAEAAVLGVKNYPVNSDSSVRYDDIRERIPVMFGLNLPAFKVLDVLALEVELYRNRYGNSYYYQVVENFPIPYHEDIDTTEAGDWKWSVYISKTVLGGLTFIGQVSRDHARIVNHEGDLRKHDFGDVMRRDEDWSWMAKIRYSF